MTDDLQAYEESKAAALELYTMTPAELRRRALPQSFIFKNALPQQGVTFITGKPGGTKSWIAYEACHCVARGTSWLHREYLGPVEGGRVLVCNYDNPTPEMARRFVQMGMLDDDQIRFHTLNLERPDVRELRFPNPEQLQQLHLVMAAWSPLLVVIDSMRQSHECDENDSKEMAAVMRSYKSLLPFGASVLVIHHSLKSGGGLRGTGEIEASADAVIAVEEEEEETYAATHTKHRGWRMPEEDKARSYRLVDSEGENGTVHTTVETINNDRQD